MRYCIIIIIALLSLTQHEAYSQRYKSGIPSTVKKNSKHKGINFKARKTYTNLIKEKWGVYISIGATSYYGDLCDKYECFQFRPNGGIGFTYRLKPRISVKTELNYYRLYSDDVWKDRNLSFRSGNMEFYTSAMIDLFAYEKTYRYRHKILPYGFIGIGLTTYNPHGELNGKWYNLRNKKTEGVSYGYVTPIIPYGIGFKYNYSRNWEFMAEVGYRKTFTDRIDDVSENKFLPQSSFEDVTAAQLSNKTAQGDKFQGYRGNPDRKDGYFIFCLKAKYTFIMKHYYRGKQSQQKRKIY